MKREYKEIRGLFFHTETSDELCNIIADLHENRKRVKFYWGDQQTGKCWFETFDITGRVGISTGRIKIPLLIRTSRSLGGGAILDDCIVKLMETETKKVLYQHPLYVEPTITIAPSNDPQFTHNVILNGETVGYHKSLRSAKKLVRQLK